MISTTIQIEGEGMQMLRQLDAALVNRVELHHDIAIRVENETRDWLTELAKSRHKTADALGATPTGHLERAAESVTSAFDDDGATITVTSPGITRAFDDLTITPGPGKKYLTIPATAEAYGKRAGAFNDLRLAIFRKDGAYLLALVKADQSSLATRESSGFGIESQRARGSAAPLKAAQRPPVYYWLKQSVTQKQDRSLLPSDALLMKAADEGVKDWLRDFFAEQAAAN